MSRTLTIAAAVVLLISTASLLFQIVPNEWLSRGTKAAPGQLELLRFELDEGERSSHPQCLIYLPKTYSPREKNSWPLTLFLHGSAQRGEGVVRALQPHFSGIPRKRPSTPRWL